MALNAIIVDDEDHSRRSLFFLIAENCPDIKIQGIVNSVADARILLKENPVDLVFLDISMPGEDGFSLLPDLQKDLTSVIFTTAFNEYAIKAIKANAVDYLLKPIEISELKLSVRRVQEIKTSRAQNTPESHEYQNIIDSLEESLFEEGNIKKINLPHMNGFRVLNINHILYILADSNYSVFYMITGEKITASKNLKEFELLFEGTNFCRIHKSTIINLYHLKDYSNFKKLTVKMADNSLHLVSRRRSPEFMESVKGMFIRR
jgi:two-component system LytT family response regulator